MRMNNKLVLIVILVGLAISMVIIGIGINRLNHLEEANTEDVASLEEELQHLQNIQTEAENIIMEDERVRELIEGKEYLKTLEIIHNESYVDEFYWIGFQYEKSKGYKMVGGKIYRFSIDLSNNTLLSVEEADNQTPDMREIRGEKVMDGAYTSIHSLASMKSFTGAWLRGSQRWLYGFKIEGDGRVKLKSDSSPKTKGWGCLKHHATIEEIYNKENFWFNEHENNPESKKAWCNGDKAPYIESELGNGLITCGVSYPREKGVWEIIKPRNWPSDAGFYY